MEVIMLELIQQYYRYNTWANNRILDTAARLTAEQYMMQSDVSFGSVHGILVHTMEVQWLWLCRWQGNSPESLPGPQEYPTLEAVRERWNYIEAQTAPFLASLTGETIQQPISYLNLKREPFTYPLWQLMQHQANHATQHRSEIAFITSQWGISPGAMDYIYYVDRERGTK
jgi:uncharacterized damage-inducible protein DinB